MRFLLRLDLKSEIKTGIILQQCFEYPIRKISRDRFYKKLIERYYRGGIRIKIKID